MAIPDYVIFYNTNSITGEVTETKHYLTAEEKARYEAEAKVKIPATVSMRQARLALLQSNLLTTVETAIASGTQADQITWEYATEVNRSDALVKNLSAALGLSETDLDNLFILASSL